MNLFKSALMLGILALSTFIIPHAHAAVCSTPNLPYTAKASGLTVSNSLAIGDVIPGSSETHNVQGSCTDTPVNAPIISCFYSSGSEVAGMPGVYQTGVEGVGIELVNSNGQVIRGTSDRCDTSSTPMGTVDSSLHFNFSFTIQLIKTATTVETGALILSRTAYGFGVYNGEPLNVNNIADYSGTVSQSTTTCSIDPLSLTVTLGDFPVSQFTHVGSYTKWTSFNINATCNAQTTFTATVTSANGVNSQYDDVINLTPGSDSATGVGVRMLIDGVDLKYNYPIPTGGTIEPNVPMAIPFSIQYFQTDAQVTSGKANTVMTIDLDYK